MNTLFNQSIIKKQLLFYFRTRRDREDFFIPDYNLKIKIRGERLYLRLLLQELLHCSSQWAGLLIDEAPMTQRYAFEALDITLRDILGFKNMEKRNQIFRGMAVLLGGDFRQILPVIPKAKRPEIVQACINRSEMWYYCKVFMLTRSMRVNEYCSTREIDTSKQEFNRWVLAVGMALYQQR
ncbi:ATP-dependent DNA helicase PIF1-like protein [Tanacetum coccineum]